MGLKGVTMSLLWGLCTKKLLGAFGQYLLREGRGARGSLFQKGELQSPGFKTMGQLLRRSEVFLLGFVVSSCGDGESWASCVRLSSFRKLYFLPAREGELEVSAGRLAWT